MHFSSISLVVWIASKVMMASLIEKLANKVSSTVQLYIYMEGLSGFW